MNEVKHTPGPWVWDIPNKGTSMARLINFEGNQICDFGDCETYYPTAGEEPSEADCNLIAAAPELLEALEAIAADPTRVAHIMDCMGRAAIAKARGEL